MGLLEHKTAVVLGASSGIGWRIAERFAEEGAELVIAARRMEKLEKLADKIGNATPRSVDIADHDAVGELAAWCLDRWGHIDVVVNSAGIAAFSMIRDLTPELMRETIDVDYLGAFWAMKHFCSAMADNGGGSFINVTSATAILVPIGLSPYSGAKAGINFVTRIAAREFGTSNVRVNAHRAHLRADGDEQLRRHDPDRRLAGRHEHRHVPVGGLRQRERAEAGHHRRRLRRRDRVPGQRHVVVDHRAHHPRRQRAVPDAPALIAATAPWASAEAIRR